MQTAIFITDVRVALLPKSAERFLDFVAAFPQERDEKQKLAATPLGMTRNVERAANSQTYVRSAP
jgi:hypothetical protein